MTKLIVSLFIVALLFSCNNGVIYDEYIAIEKENWKKENIATFEFEAIDTTTPHNLYINIRNKGEYPFNNLYLFVTINGPDGNFTKDTVNCMLADDRGKWKGKKKSKWKGKGFGNLFDYQQPYLGNVKFAKKGKYIVSYEQAMRVEDGLKGISDIGLKIEKVE